MKKFTANAAGLIDAAKKKAREYRLLAKEQTKAGKNKMMEQMTSIIEQLNVGLGHALEARQPRLKKYGLVARATLEKVHHAMTNLTPQIRYWLKTGFVASGKVINLYIPELYSIVRGKVGKTEEFGLNWGIRRLRGGYLLATMASTKNELHDTRFAVSAVDEHIALFGKPPQAYAYDRGSWNDKNVAALKKRGIKEVGLAPPEARPSGTSAAARKRCSSANGLKSKAASAQSNTPSTVSIDQPPAQPQ